jgi:tetratricopeptide (TPR) repeat protein
VPQNISEEKYLDIDDNREFMTSINVQSEITVSESVNLLYSMMEAKKMLVSGNIRESENTLKTVLIFHPRNIEALSLLAGIYYISGRYERAEESLKDVLRFSPNNYSALENLGLVLEKQQEYDEALISFKKASFVNPQSTLSLLHIAGINSILGKRGKALEYFYRAYEILGNKILPFTFDPAYGNIRDMPLFMAIIRKAGMDLEVGNIKQPVSEKKAPEGNPEDKR